MEAMSKEEKGDGVNSVRHGICASELAALCVAKMAVVKAAFGIYCCELAIVTRTSKPTPAADVSLDQQSSDDGSSLDLKGLKYFSTLRPLLEDLRDEGTGRDKAGNRTLHFEQCCAEELRGVSPCFRFMQWKDNGIRFFSVPGRGGPTRHGDDLRLQPPPAVRNRQRDIAGWRGWYGSVDQANV